MTSCKDTNTILPYECKYKYTSNNIPCTAKRTSIYENCDFHSNIYCQSFQLDQADVIFTFPRNEDDNQEKKKKTKIQKLLDLIQSDNPKVSKEAEVRLEKLRAKNREKNKSRRQRKKLKKNVDL